jgi:FK506-binding protein 4/5
MKKDERALVKIDPEYGFGAETVEKDGFLAPVPGGSTLEYTVTMLDFVKDKESWDLKEVADKLAEAGKKKEEGNALFKAGKYERACKKYEKGLGYIEYDSAFSDDEKKAAKALKVSMHLNSAASQLRLRKWGAATKAASKVLDLEPVNVKALFRRAQAYREMEDYDLAEIDLKKAMEQEPNNRDLRAEYKVLKQKWATYQKKEAKLYSNMFRPSKVEPKPHTNGTKAAEEAPPVAEISNADGPLGVAPMEADKTEEEAGYL